VVAYLFGGVAINLVPLPNLGMNSAFISSMMQSGGTGWSGGETHTTLAFGLAYFSILAAAKFVMSGSASGRAHSGERGQTARGAHGAG
jgi:hypothetical protein